jgi:hypothetical protein
MTSENKGKDGGNLQDIDASFDDDGGCGSTGATIRDGSGAMIAACSTFISHLVDAPMADNSSQGGIDNNSTHRMIAWKLMRLRERFHSILGSNNI